MKEVAVLVWDFDGVIVRNSERTKQNTWILLGKELGVKAIPVLDKYRKLYSKGNGSRFEILRDTFLELGYLEEDVKSLVEKKSERYNSLVGEGIRSEGVSKEDFLALQKLSKKYPLYINSATPEDALVHMIHELGTSSLFKGAFGYPSGKVVNLERVARIENVKPSNIIFIGDGEGDRRAAEEFGCVFAGISNSTNNWNASNSFPVVSGAFEIPNLLM